MADELKLLRNLSLQKMKDSNKKLTEHVAAKRGRMVDKYHNDVHQHFGEFENHHVRYALEAGKTLEDDDMQQVFYEASNLVDLADNTHNNFKEQLEAHANAVEERKREEEKKKEIKRKISRFQADRACVLDSIGEQKDAIQAGQQPSRDALRGELEYLQVKFKEVMDTVDSILEEVSESEVERFVSSRTETEAAFRKGVFVITSYLGRGVEDVQGNSSRSSRTTSPSLAGSSSPFSAFKTKKLDYPTFSGELRMYSTFKRDFKSLVETPGQYDKTHMSHILRHQCLTGEAKTLVHNILDYDSIWQKLEDQYNDEAEVVDQITKQITMLKTLEDGDYDGLVKLANVIERANLDLTAFGNSYVLNNPMIVRLIMAKCPRSVREEIAKDLDGTEVAREFDVLLKYLVNKRRNAQRLARLDERARPAPAKHRGVAHAADGRSADPGGGSKGWQCGVPGCTYKQKHFLAECRAFKKMNLNEKGKLVMNKKLCILCFGAAHKVDACPKKNSGWKVCDISGCGKWHSRLLHGATTPGLVLATAGCGSGRPNDVLLLVEEIPVVGGLSCITLWDSASTTSLVTFKYADRIGLEGVECDLFLTGVGEKSESFKTKLFVIPLIDKLGRVWKISAFGMKTITHDVKKVDTAMIAKMFDMAEEDVMRPVGEVDLLVGMEHAGIMPCRRDSIKKIVLYSSIFGTGFVVGGLPEQPAGCAGAGGLDEMAYTVARSESRCIKPTDFITAEGFGVDIPRRCRNCKGCQECGFRASQLTWTEAKELEQIEQGLSLDTVNKVWTASYAYNTDPSVLQNNYNQAYACMASLENRLRKTDNLDKFNAQFQDCVDRGVFVALADVEIKQYEGPVNYVTLTEAFKDEKGSTTPIRLCMNSSMKFRGRSLNDILLKGPNALNSIYEVLLNFRSYPVGILKDLSKFYNSVRASERDQHVRRVIWRDGATGDEPRIYKTRDVNFGDKNAGCLALTALRETADLYQSMSPDAAEKLKKDNYVDDIATGATDMVEAKRLSEDMDMIVSMGGFKFKKTIMTGDKADAVKVLGTGWDPFTDTFSLEVKVNVSGKKKGLRIEGDLDLEELRGVFPVTLTKRIVWRIVLGQFDLLGLASVFFIRLKLLMRELSNEEGSKLGWDEKVADDIRERFVEVLTMLHEVKTLKFPRCVKPSGVDEEYLPDLLCFGDGSKQAFCTLAYVRWKLMTGEFVCYLLSGKTRVAPLRKISVPRIELMGAVASVRLAENVQKAMRIKFGRRYFFTDSSAVLGMVKGECGAFQEFVGTRTGEIKSKSDPDKEWYWLPTKENLADMGTRDDVVPAQLAENSAYARGLPWMWGPEEDWPVSQDLGKVPEDELTPAARVVMVTSEKRTLIDLKRFSSFKKAKRVLSLVFYWLNKNNLMKNPRKGAKKEDFLKDAENYLFYSAQADVRSQVEEGRLSSLRVRKIPCEFLGVTKHLFVTSGRLGGALAIGYDKDNLPVVSYISAVARLIMYDAHQIDHSGSDRTTQRSRTEAWIIRGRKLAETVRKNCFKCRLRNRYLEKQIMAPVDSCRLPPAPVFHSTALDLFGPLEVRDTVKRRVKRKCWGVIFVCTATSAVHLEVSEDYSCDSFLLCLRRFFNLRGTPARIQSDPGSQLMAAAKELGTWDFSQIKDWAATKQTEWHFVPTDSQHFNGTAEAMIRVTKKQMQESLETGNFTKGELDTLMSEICFIINSRPLMKTPGSDPLSGGPITPLHLLGGRCTYQVPALGVDANPKLTRRLRFLENVVSQFWEKWFAQVFHNLVPSYKWKKQFRDVKEGDVVLVKEANLLKGEYRRARVKETKQGADGRVRRVILQYKNLGEKSKLKGAKFSETERSIHNIAVIVPVDWKDKEIEEAVTQGIQYKCAF